ncbi:MAG TPA: hypothetical protein VK846_17765 [Candidatus Limnocylindria bacterium]|nr:hypothetical protein [Candidatus Limnocylindria bacterium]
MNLLTVGRSLSEARNQPHRYKLTSGALPTFGNPAGPALERKFEVGAPVMRERTEDESDGRALETQPMKTESIAVETVRPAMPAGGWVNPFKTARPVVPRRAVQGELSLDKVKPVRNDLSDSDLELVAGKKRLEPAPSVVKVESIGVPVVKANPLWERVSGLFRRAK